MSINRERLRNQRIEGRPLKRAADVVRWLVASQAQDFAGAKWALGLRTEGATDTAVEREFNDGAILRTPMTAADARNGLEAIQSRLRREVVDGKAY